MTLERHVIKRATEGDKTRMKDVKRRLGSPKGQQGDIKRLREALKVYGEAFKIENIR